MPGIQCGRHEVCLQNCVNLSHVMDRKTVIKQFTQGYSLSVTEMAPAQQRGWMHAPDQAACEAWERVFWSSACRCGREQVVGNTTALPNSWRIRLFPEGNSGAQFPRMSVLTNEIPSKCFWLVLPLPLLKLLLFSLKKAFMCLFPVVSYQQSTC